MQDGVMVGNNIFTPVVEMFDPLYGYRQLYQALLDTAIRDLKKSKRVKNAALFWVNDSHARGVTSFHEVCSFLGKNEQRYRKMINQYAQDGPGPNEKIARKKKTGVKATNNCKLPGCKRKAVGQHCYICKNIIANRKFNYPYNPELWFLPRMPPGGRKSLIKFYHEYVQANGDPSEVKK